MRLGQSPHDTASAERAAHELRALVEIVDQAEVEEVAFALDRLAWQADNVQDIVEGLLLAVERMDYLVHRSTIVFGALQGVIGPMGFQRKARMVDTGRSDEESPEFWDWYLPRLRAWWREERHKYTSRAASPENYLRILYARPREFRNEWLGVFSGPFAENDEFRMFGAWCIADKHMVECSDAVLDQLRRERNTRVRCQILWTLWALGGADYEPVFYAALTAPTCAERIDAATIVATNLGDKVGLVVLLQAMVDGTADEYIHALMKFENATGCLGEWPGTDTDRARSVEERPEIVERCRHWLGENWTDLTFDRFRFTVVPRPGRSNGSGNAALPRRDGNLYTAVAEAGRQVAASPRKETLPVVLLGILMPLALLGWHRCRPRRARANAAR